MEMAQTDKVLNKLSSTSQRHCTCTYPALHAQRREWRTNPGTSERPVGSSPRRPRTIYGTSSHGPGDACPQPYVDSCDPQTQNPQYEHVILYEKLSHRYLRQEEIHRTYETRTCIHR